MKIVFHERFRDSYASDPAATRGRLNPAIELLRPAYEFVKPEPATGDDILLVHSLDHLERIRGSKHVYDMALLSAGGAIKAADLALGGEPAFALIRPPGHHASPNSCWGFCWFNNVSIAVEKMRRGNRINRAVIVDIDLHFGDGTSNIFGGNPMVRYYHLKEIDDLELFLGTVKECDILAISAGFDRHVDDWGRMLKTQDYLALGRILGAFAQKVCAGKVFSVLEGGYNHTAMAESILALITGLQYSLTMAEVV